MSTVAIATTVFLVSFAVAAGTIPLIIRLATKWHLLDHPDGGRRLHVRPVPRLGGVAVFAGLLGALILMSLAVQFGVSAIPPLTPLLPALVIGCCILFLIGLFDDLKGVRPGMKLLGQSLAALVVVQGGFGIEVISLGGGRTIDLGWVGTVVTVLWLVGVSNAYNLVDGIDGLAGTVGVIALGTLSLAAMALGSESVAYHSAALGGALVGFLVFNLSPASIFLGDSGSLVVGFLLAVLSIKAGTGTDGVLHSAIPLFALSYLMLDTGFAIMRRWLRGTPLSRADGRHVHHQLRALGLSSGRVVAVIGAASFGIGMLGLAATFMPPQATVAMAVIAIIALFLMMLYTIRWLEYHELTEAGASIASAVRKGRVVIQDRINARDLACVVARAESIDELQAALEDGAPMFRFAHMQLGTSRRGLPAHVTSGTKAGSLWKLEYPIACRGEIVDLFGDRTPDPLMLTIWCSTGAMRHPAGAERVAQILGPAIAHRLSEIPVPRAWQPSVVRGADLKSVEEPVPAGLSGLGSDTDSLDERRRSASAPSPRA